MKIAQTCQGDTLANLDQEGPNVKKTAKICYADAIARYHLPAAGLQRYSYCNSARGSISALQDLGSRGRTFITSPGFLTIGTHEKRLII